MIEKCQINKKGDTAVLLRDCFGNHAEFFDITTTKDYAIAIIKGELQLWIENCTYHNCAKFLKKYKTSDKNSIDYLKPKGIACMHIHNKTNTWFLDISIEATDIIGIHPDNLNYLHKYNFRWFDEIIAGIQEQDANKENVPYVFAFPITGILSMSDSLQRYVMKHNLNVTLYSIPDDCIVDVIENKNLDWDTDSLDFCGFISDLVKDIAV